MIVFLHCFTNCFYQTISLYSAINLSSKKCLRKKKKHIQSIDVLHPLLFPSNILFPFLQNLINFENCFQKKRFRNLQTETVKNCLLNLLSSSNILFKCFFFPSACFYDMNVTAWTFHQDVSRHYDDLWCCFLRWLSLPNFINGTICVPFMFYAQESCAVRILARVQTPSQNGASENQPLRWFSFLMHKNALMFLCLENYFSFYFGLRGVQSHLQTLIWLFY